MPKDILSEEALATILVQPSNTKIGLRDRMIMILLYDSAIRLSEALGLILSDMNLTTGSPYMRIHGKGKNDRIVSITDKTVEHLRNYMNVYHTKSKHNAPIVSLRYVGNNEDVVLRDRIRNPVDSLVDH